MIKYIGGNQNHDYYIPTDKLSGNYTDIVRFKKLTKKKRKLNKDVKDLLHITDSQYEEFKEKYTKYEVIPFMYNDLFSYAFNNDMINKEIILQYMEIYKLDHRNYIVRDRSGIYSHVIMNRNTIFYARELNCSNCYIVGNIVMCDNRLYNYKTKTFSYRFDEISLFDIRNINGKYVECAMATIIVECDFTDVAAKEEINFYIDTNGNAITPIETSIGTFIANNPNEINEVRNKVYNNLRKRNYGRRAYLKTKKM